MELSRKINGGTAVIYGVEHMMTDFLCHFFMFRFVYGIFSAEVCVILFLLYNFLAFALQCPIGYLCDKLRAKQSVGIAYAMIFITYALVFFGVINAEDVVFFDSTGAKIWIIVGVVVLGLANSMFHAGGCKAVMCAGERGLKNGGVFIAFGALGVGFGDYCGKYSFMTPVWVVCVISIVIIEVAIMDAVLEAGRRKAAVQAASEAVEDEGKAESTIGAVSANERNNAEVFSATVLVLCLVAIMARSYGGFCLPNGFTKLYNPFTGTALEELGKSMSSSVLGFMGKLLGGFLVVWSVRLFKSKTDIRIANLRYGTIALIISAILCGVFGSFAVPCAIGIILFHSIMPVTLYEVYCLFPENPGFCLGMTTLMLFLGLLPNYLYTPEGTVKTVLFVVTTVIAAVCLFAGTKLIGSKIKETAG